MTYAKGTDVSVDRSKAELEKILARYGAVRFISGWDQTSAVIGFEMRGRQVKITVPIPSKRDPSVLYTPGGKYVRRESAALEAWNGIVRQRYRALVLIVKAKLEAVDAGIATFESEFLGDLVLPGSNRTVGELVIPRLDDLPGLMLPEHQDDPEGS